MSLEAITQKIISDAEKEAQVITREANRQIQQIKSDLETHQQQLRKKSEEQTAAKQAQNRQRVLTGAEAEIKKQLEKEKRRQLDDTYDLARQQLENLNSADYRQLLKQLLGNMDSQTPISTAEISLPTDRLNDSQAVLDELDLKFAQVKTDPDLIAGAIIRGSDFEYDLRFDVLISNLQTRTEVETAAILFSSSVS